MYTSNNIGLPDKSNTPPCLLTHTHHRPVCYLHYVFHWPGTHKFPLPVYTVKCMLTHWGRVTQICIFTLQLHKTD